MPEPAEVTEVPAGGAPAAEAPAGGVDSSELGSRLDALAGTLGGIEQMLTAPAEPEYGPDPYGGQDPYGPPAPYGQPAYPPQQQQPAWQPQQPGFPPQQPGFGQQAGFPQQGFPQQGGAQGLFPLDPTNVYDEQGNVNPYAANQYMQALQQAAVQPALAPVMQQQQQILQQLDEMRFNQGSERLEQQYPELAEKEKADALVARAIQMAPTMGLDPRQAVRNDGYLELVHQSMRVQEAAAGERPASGQQAHELEPGGGAGPAGSQPSFSDQLGQLQGNGAPNKAAADFWGAGGL